MIYPLDRRNTKKLKNQKLKCWVFTNNSLILVKLFKKKPKYLHIFLWKNTKITILFWVLVFSFTYLVLVYPMDSTKISKFCVSKIFLLIFGGCFRQLEYWLQKYFAMNQHLWFYISSCLNILCEIYDVEF